MKPLLEFIHQAVPYDRTLFVGKDQYKENIPPLEIRLTPYPVSVVTVETNHTISRCPSYRNASVMYKSVQMVSIFLQCLLAHVNLIKRLSD